jgi:hypothetical protein
MTPPLYRRLLGKDPRLVLYRVYQRAMLKIPVLSELRLASDKVMEFLRAWHYLARAQVSGDYLEFGVFEGMSFELSLTAASKFYDARSPRRPRFFAFDSFSGLPEPDQSKDGRVWEQGTYYSSLETFKRNTARASRGWDVKIVEGFYNQTLVPSLRTELGLREAAFINIDCDLYESTLDALNFCTPLVKTGTLIFFDDWYASEGDLSLGEARAAKEWLSKNPHITLIDFGDVAIMGKMFLVNVNTSAAPPGG